MSSASRKSKFRYPHVIVSWHDACEDGAEVSPEEIAHEPTLQHLAGWLVKDNKRGVTVAFEYNDDDGGLRTTQFVPRGMVVKVYRTKL